MSGKSLDVFALRDSIIGEVPKLNGSPAEAPLLGRDP